LRFLFLLLVLASPATAQVLDGAVDEHPVADDDAHDGGLITVRAQAWADGLWIGLEFDEPVDADSGSGLVLHLDADGNRSTGDDHGCELVFDLKARHGSLHPDRDLPGSGRLFQKLGIEIAPAFRSEFVEVFIPRLIRGGASLFTGPTMGFFVVSARDRAPEEGFIDLDWSTEFVAVEPIEIERTGMLRIAAWNVEQDGLFDPELRETQDRILRALDADVLVVMESFREDAEAVLARAEDLRIYEHAVKADPGNVVLSRFPIVESWPLLSLPKERYGYRGSAVLIDTPNGEFMVLPQHWRCCAKGEKSRLFEADAVIGFLRDAFTEGGNFTLESEPPFAIIGDLNLVISRRPLDVVLSGIVVDKDSYGPDFPPGPGRTPLQAVPLRHSHAPFTYTWHTGDTKYYSARLDWALVPTSVMVERAFVLDTGTMFGATLKKLGMRRRDSRNASDHMPIVLDVSWD
jgi:endonuclease/exonuclease/phosphatase family metal-dependent hydrolase